MTTIKLKYKDILDLYVNGQRTHLCHVLCSEFGYSNKFARRVILGIAADVYGRVYGRALYLFDMLGVTLFGIGGSSTSSFEAMFPSIGMRVAEMVHRAGIEHSGDDTPEYRRKMSHSILLDSLGKTALRCDMLRALVALCPDREFVVSD